MNAITDLIASIKEAAREWKRRRAYRKFRDALPDPFKN